MQRWKRLQLNDKTLPVIMVNKDYFKPPLIRKGNKL